MRALVVVALVSLVAGCVDEAPSLEIPTDAPPATGPDPAGVSLVVTVTDATSNSPIENATVRLRWVGATGQDLESRTGPLGVVAFRNVPPGTYPIVLNAAWYKVRVVNVTLTESVGVPVALDREGARTDVQDRGTSVVGLVFAAPDPAEIVSQSEVMERTGKLSVKVASNPNQLQPLTVRLFDPAGKEQGEKMFSGLGTETFLADADAPAAGTWRVVAEARVCAPRCDIRVTWTHEGPWGTA